MSIVEINVITGDRTERDLTAEELAELPDAAELESAQRIAVIDTRLAEIDQLSARPAREVALALMSGAAADSYVTDKLAALEADAVALRAERKGLVA